MQPFILQDLVNEHPVLRTYTFQSSGSGDSKNLIQTLAECGYRFAEIEAIIRAQKSEQNILEDYFSCQIVKIEQCL